MNKPELVFCGPVATVSGYGDHSRDLVQSLIESDLYNISIISINWGETPMDALNTDNPIHKKILELIRVTPIQERPDIWMQCTIPSEFQPVGKYNIGVTAGIETDTCSGEWIDGCNRMNLIIVPSKHAKSVFESTEYARMDKNTNQQVGVAKITVPIEILFEGVRTDVFNRKLPLDVTLSDNISSLVKEDFAFLFVGHWLKGDFGQDRKDISGLIMTFIKAFSHVPNAPALVLKTSCGTFSVSDRSNVMSKIKLIREMAGEPLGSQPSIYLLHGDLTENELNTLYNHPKIKALVSFTKGEGYGRPIAEFITSGKPVAVSGWSGHVDFVNPVFHIYLDGKLDRVHPSAVWEGVINSDSRWFSVDYQKAVATLRMMFKNYTKLVSESKKSVDQFNLKWSYTAMSDKFTDLLTAHLPKFAQKMTIKLPTLIKKDPVQLEEGITQ